MKVTSATSPLAESLLVSVDHIIKHKEMNYRPVDSAAVTELSADIGANGLLNPIVTFSPSAEAKIALKGKGESFPSNYLAAGQHRLEAIKLLRKNDKAAFDKQFKNGVPVRRFIGDVQAMLFAMLRENLKRREMLPEEIFPVLETLANEHKLSGKEIASHIGKSTGWVSQHMAVNQELDEETKEEVVKGDINVGDARKLAAEVRKDRKEGKEVTKDQIREKASELKSKKAAKTATGNERAAGEDRRVSPKKIYSRLKALRKLPLSRELEIYKGAMAYIVCEANKLPAEIRKDVAEEKPAVAAKVEKKAKK